MVQLKRAVGLISVLFLSLVGFPIATGQTLAPEEELRTRLAAELQRLNSQDYKPASGKILEPVAKGTAKRFPLQLGAGTYAVVGACGGNCDHVQLLLYGPDGALLIASPEKQPVVVISGAPAVAGSYTLELAAPGCKEQVCQTGFVVARHEGGIGPGPALARPSMSSHDGGGFVVHVASERSRDEALATFAGLRDLAPAALASAEAIIEKVDLGAQGMWHRLRIGPPMTEDKARAICDALKVAGHAYCNTQIAGMSGSDGKGDLAAAPKRIAGPFDGTWVLSWNTAGCELPDGATTGRYQIAISAGEMTGQNGRLHGKIASNGAARWTVTAKIDGVNVRYMGNFSGTSANGKFSRADGSCEGTFTVRKKN